MNLGDILNALYDSEINISVVSFWDGGWTIKIGDPSNGYVAERNFKELDDECVRWIIKAAQLGWPDSYFTRQIGAREGLGVLDALRNSKEDSAGGEMTDEHKLSNGHWLTEEYKERMTSEQGR